MAINVTQRAIFDNIKKPDLLAITYPATYPAVAPSSNRLMALIDPLVNINFLKMVGKNYIPKECNPEIDPFLSPAITPIEILQEFPPTYINVGSLDPLFDDTVYFVKRLQSVNKKVKLEVYDNLGHGYLNMTGYVPEGQEASKNLVSWVNKMI